MRPAVVAGANEYQLQERVATTALGSVHRAQHVASGRVVEVRLLRRLVDDPAGALAFAEALPAIASLRHRSILPVESWGDTDGVPSVVTPLLDAEPLSARLERAWLPDRAEALRLLRGVADAVDHAHRFGVVHGDLDPATVLVAADGSALVAHFGLARLAGATPLPGGTGLRHGSLVHVAPERVVAGTLIPASDVYAFAAIAWQLLSGRVPPAGAGELPGPAVALLRRGLDRDPAARWATCGALVDAVEVALSGRPAAAAPSPAMAPPPAPAAPVPRAAQPPAVSEAGPQFRAVLSPRRATIAAAAGVLLLGVLAAVIVIGGGVPLPNPAAATRVPPRAAPTLPDTVPPDTPAPPTPAPTSSATPAARPTPTLPAPVVASPPAPSPTTPALSMTASDTTVSPGQANVQVSGRGFDATQQYTVDFVQGTSRQRLFGPASPRADGSFTNPVRIPSSARPGTATLVSCVYLVQQDETTTRCAQVTVHVRGQGS